MNECDAFVLILILIFVDWVFRTSIKLKIIGKEQKNDWVSCAFMANDLVIAKCDCGISMKMCFSFIILWSMYLFLKFCFCGGVNI